MRGRDVGEREGGCHPRCETSGVDERGEFAQAGSVVADPDVVHPGPAQRRGCRACGDCDEGPAVTHSLIPKASDAQLCDLHRGKNGPLLPRDPPVQIPARPFLEISVPMGSHLLRYDRNAPAEPLGELACCLHRTECHDE
jgi:hypothetical protein